MIHGQKQKIRTSTDQIRFYLSFLFFSASIFLGCVSYDAPVIYHKNFQPGTHDKLRFDGYYSVRNANNQVKPIFFYRDGSVWFGEVNVPVVNLSAIVTGDGSCKHSWGNYRIEGDTIHIERFSQESNTGNYNRIITKGEISDDAIHWKLHTFRKSDPDSTSYSVYFEKCSAKPDSTYNWTRKLEKFNK